MSDDLDLDVRLEPITLTHREAFAIVRGLEILGPSVAFNRPLHNGLSDELGIPAEGSEEAVCICGIWADIHDKLTFSRDATIARESGENLLGKDLSPSDFTSGTD